MTWFVKAFLKASLAWLALGVTLGVAMAVHPAWTIYRLAHIHMLLIGFVTMMIYGVAYHVIPRFVGFNLHRAEAAQWHWWGANLGLALMAAGFMLRPHGAAAATPVLATGGVLSALGAYAFVYGLWRTIDGPAELRAARRRAEAAAGARLPVAGAAAAPRR
ncbi:MAG TPA: hypothetical protein VF048_01650 [Gemmatimonadaceae bacterium]